MNWTGGNLSRHRRGKGWKEEMARQKEYFAKARSRRLEGVKSSPVPLSAANFIPNYTSPPEAPTGLGSATSTLISKPACAADEISTSLDNPPEALQREVTELSLLVSPGKMDEFPMLNQASKYHSMGASDLETALRETLKKGDFERAKLPKLSVMEPARHIFEHPPLFKLTLEQQRRTSTGRDRISPSFDRQKDMRTRGMIQNTPSPSPRSARIRIGSQDYRWSVVRNSIGNLTFGDHSATKSTVSKQTKYKTQPGSISNASYIINESFTGFSLSSSDLSLSSPGRNRAARRQELHNSPNKVVGAASAEFKFPLPHCACGAAMNVSPAASEIESTDSIAVQVSDGELGPQTETDEERIWRQWLG
ncbi:uncharacterized protein TRIVIDRAFT_219445 [Trichoderma virens Gv29-8]|uniref:Uncharacterized protein n=1 Tax=Hypocrea virens (strain Gv29-8 / FGSC 10586) TaxID=413071 RepID=G9MJM0_HYPVG|nr:uncharacterized protein TRIVIDRAFT_219445 [Trichoderma virens Gv29-8]EHK25683.1 hypothetical protein TRIVIDRAFT_219445 [Trichoderma virens Gv29-8]UKZ48499.1 hypothetical protein TrVGV298_002724 [Trichoderma virens]